MYTELSFYDADKRQDAVLDTIFQALDKKVENIIKNFDGYEYFLYYNTSLLHYNYCNLQD